MGESADNRKVLLDFEAASKSVASLAQEGLMGFMSNKQLSRILYALSCDTVDASYKYLLIEAANRIESIDFQ
jgi:hypothetical protein